MNQDPCVLLISPGIIKWEDMDFGLPHLVSIGGYIQEQMDVRVEILDLNYEGGDHRQLERTLEELGPYHVIGLSCFSSFDYMRVMTLARFLKRLYPQVPLVTGGYHASALPEDVIFDGSPFDAAIPGEGEAAMLEVTKTVVGGGQIDKGVWPQKVVEDLDELPMYQWQLLDRYWPRAQDIGRKFQIYLSRGCPFRCTFCMERAKTGYRWRAYSAERAVAELERLAEFTDLSEWIVNIADPLFGIDPKWRRAVLEGIIEKQLLPRQYWTLTRSDNLKEEDVQLLADAHFSIGIGMETGSPKMLQLMQKTRNPQGYLDAQRRLARLSREKGLNWSANIIVGHPGETMETMRQTRDFVYEVFASAKETCGWVSLAPFRLYPGSHVHEAIDHYRDEYGATFYHPEWWKSWYDGPFRAQHIDPSDELDYESRVNFMYDNYRPIIEEVIEKFRGQGRSVDRVFDKSLARQKKLMSDQMRNRLLRRAARSRRRLDDDTSGAEDTPVLEHPIGLHIKDEWVRRRESAVRRLLQRGVLRTERLVEAFLKVDPRDYLSGEEADSFLRNADDVPKKEGEPASWLGIDTCATAFEALNPGLGDRAADLLASRGYVTALFSELVGENGEVKAVHPAGWWSSRRLKKSLRTRANVDVGAGTATTMQGLDGEYDAIWFGGAWPSIPEAVCDHLRAPTGRMVTFVGPRIRAQDLVCLTHRDDELHERIVARVQVPVVAGPNGWLSKPKAS